MWVISPRFYIFGWKFFKSFQTLKIYGGVCPAMTLLLTAMFVVWYVFFSLVYFISAVASPVCGFAIDRVGRNVFWLMIGVLVTLVCHGVMAFTFLTPFIPMVNDC